MGPGGWLGGWAGPLGGLGHSSKLIGTWGCWRHRTIGCVSSGKKLLSRNFRVWNLDAGPMALKFRFTAFVFFNELGLHMQSALCNYILIMEATTIGSKL
ncbi:unnamed protein product [Prunus armeniaca]